MDRAELAARLNAMSDEDLLKLVGPQEEENRERPFVDLPDGTRVEANSAEELNRLLVSRLSEYREREEPTPGPAPNADAPKVRKWDYKKFQQAFVDDPRAGMEFLEEVQTGIPGGYTKMVPLLINALGELTRKVTELETQDFLNASPDYEPSVENRKVLDKIISDRGWKVSNDSLSDAFDIAKARGLIRGTEHSERSEFLPFIPPRTRRSMGTETEPETVNEIVARAESMDLKDLQKLLIAAGHLKSEHV